MKEAPSRLESLVAPFAQDEFLDLWRQREFAFRTGSNGDGYAPLVGWQALRGMIEAGNYPKSRPDDIRVSRESHIVPPDRWTTDGKVDVAKLDAFLAQGCSIVVLHLDEHVPALGAICDEIKSTMSEGAFVGVIVTSGASRGAFKLHFDPEDLLIVQVEGTKRWQVFGPPATNPVRGMPKPPPPDTEPIFDEVLTPGDLLFVPAGNWHHCECGLSTSVHLGIFFLPPTGWHAINELVRPLLAEELFRTPLTRFASASDAEKIEASIRNRLLEKVGELKLTDFVGQWPKAAY